MFDDIIKKNREKAQKMAQERIEGFEKVIKSYRINRRNPESLPRKPEAQSAASSNSSSLKDGAESSQSTQSGTSDKKDTLVRVDFTSKTRLT
jgi:hypothetical protein